ncbi:MAG: protein kinase [Actinomycetota bacterium]|nr:protein kinase [Actinomycetota bacterium]
MPPDDVTARPIGGRYELQGLLGQGGMGTVWRGVDTLLQRPVAVKRVELPLHLPEAERAALRQRVLREARAAARVSHPRLVTIFDVVEEDGMVFLVQELVDAPTLKAIVGERGPLPPSVVAAIGSQLVDGLSAAHGNGVIHRDVKPSNVMVLPGSGGIKLADFGIASLHGDPQITATGMIVGSPAYMAPEQAVGNKAGPAADLWSVGATLYFAVEGEAPFGRADTLSTLTAVVHEEPRSAVIAGPLAPLLTRLLAKDPAARPEAAEVSSILGRVERSSSDETATGSRAAPAESTAVAPPTVRSETTTARPAPAAAAMPMSMPAPRRWLGVAIALVLVLLAGGVALAASLGDDGDGAGETANEPTTPTTGASNADPQAAPTTTARPASTTSAPTATTAAPVRSAAAVPADWVAFRDEKTGYGVSHPPGWRVQSRDGTRTDFTDPTTGTYLRVDWTDKPGESAQADWERQSGSFGARQQNYRQVRIEPTTFSGSENASLWEYTYTSGGAPLHAYNLGFVLGDDYGFALNFQTSEQRFAESQALFEQLKAGFTPPAGD